MKRLLITTCLLIVTSIHNSNAQNYADSLVLTYVKWFSVDLGNELAWNSYHFNQNELFGSNQNVNILRTKITNRKLSFAFASADSANPDSVRTLRKTSVMALSNNAVAAINGGFFNLRQGGAIDFLRINGKLIDSATYMPDKPIPEHSMAAITIDDNKVSIVKGGKKLYWERDLTAPNVMVTGPLLLYEGVEENLRNTAYNYNRHPRTCACITTDDYLLLITVDGRNALAQGMTLPELTYTAIMLGCKTAVNLDGGGSTTMYIKGKNEHGVVNRPSDNKQFDHFGERSVSNIFLISDK